VTIEYVMLANVNDSIEDARRLARPWWAYCKINLIPFNPFPGSRYQAPDNQRVSTFSKILQDSGYFAIVRASKGADIQAACGQLKGRYEELEAGEEGAG
jgi:23S rRNA (adenine2503-C2)-methyltransferase